MATWKSHYVLGLLLVVYVLNQADRQVISVLIPGGMRCSANGTKTTDTDCISFSDTQQVSSGSTVTLTP